MSLNYRFNVNGKKFLNFFQAHDYGKINNSFVDFKLDKSDVESLLSVDVGKLAHTDIRALFKKKLQWVRDNFKKLRLFYSAGIDSHTILQLSQEMGIEFDSVMIETCSLNNDPALDAEMEFGIKYAEQTGVKNFEVIKPEIKQFERYLDPFWVKDVCASELFGFRGAKFDVALRDIEPMTCVSGMDKAWLYVSAQGKYYWVMTDHPYKQYMRFEHLIFFADSNIPEVAVKQAYMVKKWLQERRPNYRGLFTYDDGRMTSNVGKLTMEDRLSHLNAIGRTKPLSRLQANPSIMGKRCPLYLNPKHQGVMRELELMGREDLVKAFYHSLEVVKDHYKDHNYCLGVDTEGHPVGINRYAAVFELNDDHMKHVSDDVIDLSLKNN